jgi:hypothetical protein
MEAHQARADAPTSEIGPLPLLMGGLAGDFPRSIDISPSPITRLARKNRDQLLDSDTFMLHDVSGSRTTVQGDSPVITKPPDYQANASSRLLPVFMYVAPGAISRAYY